MRISGLASAVLVAICLGLAGLGLTAQYVKETRTPPIVFASAGGPSVSGEETDAALSASDQGGNVASSTTDEEVCPPAPPTDPAAWASEDASYLVDINRATLDELIQLPGIGPAYAQRIIELRELRSGFVYKEELMDVSGIGPARFARLKDLITVGPYPGATDSAGEE